MLVRPGMLLSLQSAFDTAVGNQPEAGNDCIQAIRQPWTNERERDRCQVNHRRELAFPVTAQSHCQQRMAAFRRNNGPLQNVVRDCRRKQDHAVNRRRRGRMMVIMIASTPSLKASSRFVCISPMLQAQPGTPQIGSV